MARMAHKASLRLVLVLALLLLAVPFTLGSAGAVATAATAKGSAKTVSGDWHPYEPLDGTYDADNGYWMGTEDQAKTPSVTVDQSTNLTDQFVSVSWRNFTPSSDSVSYADGDGNFNTPSRFDGEPDLQSFYDVNVYECRGAHPTVNPILNGQAEYKDKAECYDASVVAPIDGPFGQNNAVPAVTSKDGTGRVSFHVENKTTNDLLRCSSKQQCSIVVVPNQGGVSTVGSDSTDQCGDHSQDQFHGPDYDQGLYSSVAINNQLSACAWAKRIIVPLSFAPLPESCPDSSSSFNVSGSPPLRRGMNQLQAGWCRGSRPVSFDYDFSSSEAAARTRFLTNVSTGLSSDTDVALTSEPADPSLAGQRPFRYAPVANDAVSIPYEIDNPKTGQPITDLRLTARLVAKLLTQSYAPRSWNCAVQKQSSPKDPFYCAKSIPSNPLSIFDDKEFQALNFRGDHPDRASFPNYSDTGSQQTFGSFFPTVVSGDSDMTFALTRWIASDPAANAFLRGAKDGFNNDAGGMRINPNYRIKGSLLYPTTSFNALDPGYTAPNVAYGGSEDHDVDRRTTQGFQGSWNPVGSASQVIANLARNRSTATNSSGVCLTVPDTPRCDLYKSKPSLSVNFARTNPEPFGVRDLTAVTDNTDAQAYDLPTAQLLTYAGDFVSPSTTSLAKATAALRTNADGVTQSVSETSLGDGAYPLLMPVYAMVPTCGVSSAKAAGIRGMLDHVVGSQRYGTASGTLAPGLLKLTAKQLADTRKAASLVSSKKCPKPSGASSSSGSSKHDNDNNSGGSGGSSGGSGGTTSTPTASAPTPPTSAPAASTPASSTPGSVTRAQNVGYRSNDDGGALTLLPILLLLGGLILIGGPLAWWGAGTGPGQIAVSRARHLAREGATDLRNLLPGRWRS